MDLDSQQRRRTPKIHKITTEWYLSCIFLIHKLYTFFRTWIGIHDIGDATGKEGNFRCTSDEEKISFASWHAGEPNDWGKGEDCTEINFRDWGNKQQWNDIACSHKKPFVCESETKCPEGFERKAGNCYKFVTEKKNFNDAENDCKEQGGHLACPKSAEENKAIHALAEGR